MPIHRDTRLVIPRSNHSESEKPAACLLNTIRFQGEKKVFKKLDTLQ